MNFPSIIRFMHLSQQLALALLLLFTGCIRAPVAFEPLLPDPVHSKQIARERRSTWIGEHTPSPFAPLSSEERATDWGKEYQIGLSFAADFDLYRAITAFKRSCFFSPPEERLLEIQYATALAYFLGGKYTEVAYIAESTSLGEVSNQFPAFHDLVLMLHESYLHLGQQEHAQQLVSLLDAQEADKLLFLSAVKGANFAQLTAFAEERPYLQHMMTGYEREEKSAYLAQTLNAVLPGAGYWYVGQKQTAMTALLVNSLFIGAATYFFVDGNIPAGLITASLESGWYFGGIYGARLATQTYNEKIYRHYAEEIGKKEQYYPLMMLKYSF